MINKTLAVNTAIIGNVEQPVTVEQQEVAFSVGGCHTYGWPNC